MNVLPFPRPLQLQHIRSDFGAWSWWVLGGRRTVPRFIPTLGKSAAIAIVQSSQFEFLLIHLHLPDAAPSHAGVRCAAGGGGSDVGVLEAGWGSRDFHERMG